MLWLTQPSVDDNSSLLNKFDVVNDNLIAHVA